MIGQSKTKMFPQQWDLQVGRAMEGDTPSEGIDSESEEGNILGFHLLHRWNSGLQHSRVMGDGMRLGVQCFSICSVRLLAACVWRLYLPRERHITTPISWGNLMENSPHLIGFSPTPGRHPRGVFAKRRMRANPRESPASRCASPMRRSWDKGDWSFFEMVWFVKTFVCPWVREFFFWIFDIWPFFF